MKKAFTLIELMISILLLALIVTFLYQSVAQLQRSNQQFLKKSEENSAREALLKLLYNDFINAISVEKQNESPHFDVISLQTQNSLHNMSQPYVSYRVYHDEVLRRVESPTEKIDFINMHFRFNDMIKGVKELRLYESKGHHLLYLKAEGIDDIYLDLLPPTFLSQKQEKKDTRSVNDDTNVSQGQEG